MEGSLDPRLREDDRVIPLSLYIHFPWCIKKCPYCDFNSHVLSSALPETQYIQALLQDLDQDLPRAAGRSIQTIFMGGGTPSLFSGKAFKTLLQEIRARLDFVSNIEVTLEANPGTVEHGRFAEYRAAGINRISLGAQSFQISHLKRLGRIHGPDEIMQAVNEIKTSGFDNFNLDMMYGLPNQTVAEALDDLQRAIALKPTHLSWYQLTIEPNTVFYSKPPKLPVEGILAEIEVAGKTLLRQFGFQQYEISAYSQSGFQSRHNLNYWQFGDYLGIGAGAHSKVTDFDKGEIVRICKHRQPKSYLNPDKNFIADEQVIEQSELPLEFMLNALRLNQGFTVQQFEASTGLSICDIETALQQGYGKGLLERCGDRIAVTKLGLRFLNDTLLLFQ